MDLKRGQRESDRKVMVASVDGRGDVRLKGRVDSKLTATDQKTAFLIAFATLGYRFAFGKALDVVRDSILQGSTPPVGGPVDPAHILTAGYRPETVVTSDAGTVEVVGHDFAWQFISGSGLRAAPGTKARGYTSEWAVTHEIGRAKDMDIHLASGDLFHGDYCRRPGHHTGLDG